MENIANNAQMCNSDIKSGEKEEIISLPENEKVSVSYDADKTENKAEKSADLQDKSGTPEENANLDAEFEMLIKGKYRDCYRKRTENIIKKRLKSVKKDEISEIPQKETESVSNNVQEQISADTLNANQKKLNKIRPEENGVGSSIGVYTRINVSALTGSDVRKLLNRAAGGEKITFKN